MRTLGRTIDTNLKKPTRRKYTKRTDKITRPNVVSVRLSNEELKRLEDIAFKEDCSLAEILRKGFDLYMEGQENKHTYRERNHSPEPGKVDKRCGPITATLFSEPWG